MLSILLAITPISWPGTDTIAPAAAAAPAVYNVTDLGAFGAEDAWSVNDFGDVVGTLNGGGGFHYRVDSGTWTDLGPGAPRVVSDTGKIFGLGFGTGAGGKALGASPDGQVAAGGTFQPGVIPPGYGPGTSWPGVWSAGEGWRSTYDAGCRIPHMIAGAAYAINPSGVFVGQAILDDDGRLENGGTAGAAFKCSPDPANPGQYVARNIGDFGGAYAGAFAINRQGQIAGKAHLATGSIEAFRWLEDSLPEPLGTFASGHPPTDGFSQSAAYGNNDHGDIVGTYGPTASSPNLTVGSSRNRAFVWSPSDRTMHDLGDLVGADSGWTFNVALDINNHGQIVGQGRVNGEQRAFLLTPKGDVNVIPDRIVVTQVIQNEENLNLLVARKQTYAIVRAHSDTRDVPGVTAVLRGYRNGTLLGEVKPMNPPITVRREPKLADANQSFIFALPPGWTDAGNLALESDINNDFKAVETNYRDNDVPPAVVTFQESPLLKVVVVDLNYAGQATPPNATAYNDLRKIVGRMFPVPALDIHHEAAVVPIAEPVTSPGDDPAKKCGDVVKELTKIRSDMKLDAQTLVYGQLPLKVDGTSPYGGGVGGCSYVPDMVATGWTGPGSAEIAAHELSHAIGRNHVPYCKATGADTPGYPATGHARIYAGSIHQESFRLPGNMDLGFDGSNFKAPFSSWDLMTYCNKSWWISDYTYENLFREIPQIGTRKTAELQQGTPGLQLIGAIDLRDESTSMSLTAGPIEIPPLMPLPGPYHIEFYDGDRELSSVAFTPVPMGPHGTSGAEVPRLLVNETVELPSGADRVAIYSDQSGKEIFSAPIGGTPPAVALTIPQANAELNASGSMTISWLAEDGDGDSLRHTVLYRPDTDASWDVLAHDVEGSSAVVDLAALAGSTSGTVRVVTHDGLFTAQDEVSGLRVPDKAPSVTIDTPADDQFVTTEQALLLSGSANTVEGVDLSDSAFAWVSDKDGHLGTGPSLVANTLSVGKHRVELIVTAPSGQVGKSTVNVVVGESGSTPSRLVVDHDEIGFTAGTITPPAAQTIGISDLSGAAVAWTASTDDERVTLSAHSGTTPAEVGVSVDVSNLSAGEELTAHVTVQAADSSQDPLTVNISAQSSAPTVALSRYSIDFGRQTQGTTGTSEQVTVSYNGPDAIRLGTASLAGPSPSDYELTADECSNQILVSGANCTLSIAFGPDTAGRRTAFVVIPDADSIAQWYISTSGLAPRQLTPPEGTLLGWGDNSFGQAGIDPSTPPCDRCVPVPTLVSGIGDVAAVASGSVHSVAATNDGRAWAWGQNCVGTLGNGTTDCPDAHPTPQPVAGVDSVIDVAAGPEHSLALRRDGTILAWGSNMNGLGFVSGTIGCGSGVRFRSSPVPVRGPGCTGELSGVVDLAAGGQTDGNTTSYALRSDGTVWQWGSLGPGSSNNTVFSGPVQVIASGGAPLSNIIEIAHGMALRSDGTVWTWGYGADGQLGNGQRPPTSAQAVQVLAPDGAGALTGVAAIAAHANERYALRSDGTLFAWGSGRAANRFDVDAGIALGIGGSHPDGVALPAPVLAPGSTAPVTGVADVAAGLAVLPDGNVSAWGQGIIGSLGDGTYMQNPWTVENLGPTSPVRVKGAGGQGLLSGVAALSGGETRFALSGAGSAASTLIAGPSMSFEGSEGSVFDGLLATFDDTSTAIEASQFSANVDWGDGTNSWAKVTGPAGGPFEVAASHVYDNPGDRTVKVDVLSRDGDSIALEARASISPAELVAVPVGNVSFTAGAESTQTVGSFRDLDPSTPASAFTASINWGDGAVSAEGTVLGPPGGPFLVTGAHAYSRAGTYEIAVDGEDDQGRRIHIVSQAVVKPANLIPITTYSSQSVSGTTISGRLATFTDGNPLSSLDHYTAVIDWGDGTESEGEVSGDNGGPYTVGGTHTYESRRPYTASIRLNGPAEASAIAYSTILQRQQQISLTSSVNPPTAAVPFEGTFTYVVANKGEDPVMMVEVEGDFCGKAALTIGDNNNGVLDPTEQWTFTCKANFTDVGTFTDVAWGSGISLTEGISLRTETVSNEVIATAPGWPFSGFFAPVKNPPSVNVVKPGSVIPVRFSLGGPRGTDIFSPGFPASASVDCTTGTATGSLEGVSLPGTSSLIYDNKEQRYQLNWQTSASWSGTCRKLILRFKGGGEQFALFQFK